MSKYSTIKFCDGKYKDFKSVYQGLPDEDKEKVRELIVLSGRQLGKSMSFMAAYQLILDEDYKKFI